MSENTESHKILSPNKFGFWSGRGTKDPIECFTGTIAGNMDRGMKSISLFLDLAKVFDTISHKILLKILPNIGKKEKAFQWIDIYISN